MACSIIKLVTFEFTAKYISVWTAIVAIGLVFDSANARCDDSRTPVPSDEVVQAQAQRVAAIALATQSTVGVFGTDGQGGGSGVIVSKDGYVVTNYHVSSPFGDRMRCGLSDGKMVEAVIVGIDPTGDIALLKMYGRDSYPAAIIADSDTVQAGNWCFAAGNPFVLATNLQPSITYGIVSGVHRYQYPAGTILEYTDCIQTDAAINPGNSGGPLFNADGHLIGINGRCSFEKRGRVNVGVGYAISINQVLKFLGQLRAGRLVDHATLGFTVATDPDGKVVVSNILESSDAFRRGLRYGDEVLEIAQREIKTTNQFKNILGIFPSDWRIGIRYRNEEGMIESMIRLERLHAEEELEALVEGEKPKGQLPEEPKPEKGKGPKRPNDKPGDKETENPNSPDGPKKSKNKSKGIDPLADRLEKRSGYINYYFNRQELKRIQSLQKPLMGWKETKGSWNMSGSILGEPTQVELRIEKENLRMSIDGKEHLLDSKGAWSRSVTKQEPALMLGAFWILQRWCREGPGVLGDVSYFGEAPILGTRTLVDVVKVTIGDVDCSLYSDTQSGDLLLIEMVGEKDRDPAEIYFDSYREDNLVRWPNRVRLQFGLEPKLQLDLTSVNWNELSSKIEPKIENKTETKTEAPPTPSPENKP